MSQRPFPPFDALEARELLSTAHHAAKAHAKPAAATAPLVLDGTLTVNKKAATVGREHGRRR